MFIAHSLCPTLPLTTLARSSSSRPWRHKPHGLAAILKLLVPCRSGWPTFSLFPAFDWPIHLARSAFRQWRKRKAPLSSSVDVCPWSRKESEIPRLFLRSFALAVNCRWEWSRKLKKKNTREKLQWSTKSTILKKNLQIQKFNFEVGSVFIVECSCKSEQRAGSSKWTPQVREGPDRRKKPKIK